MIMRCVHLVWVALAVVISSTGCSSQSAEQDEQSKAQSGVIGDHFKDRQPETRK